ncbi:hypothetical protein ALC57_07199 [Trachymyrmex cornetzi]|uniref:Uncharacterized protein n=1 Tax=Trachymyrmex cornetzi TaxID=471704 RepID=A0A195E533_9HYME|nr:hypothetical protein ALC57_07199 [Trachymyrmex cornetzi]
MFGCICPNNHMKRRCDKIFSTVNHNPCVGESNNNMKFVKFSLSIHVFIHTSIVHVITCVILNLYILSAYNIIVISQFNCKK